MYTFLQRYAVPLSLTLVCVTTWLLADTATYWLEYNRQAVNQGQWWRFISANLVHLGSWHTLMNLASLWLISFIFLPLLKRRHWIVWFLFLYIANIAAMHWWVPSLTQYVGMSGALYGLIAACCIAEFKQGIKISGVLLLLVGLKIFAPQILGITSEYDDWLGGTVIEESHIIGYIEGLILGLVWPKQLIQQTALTSSLGIKKTEKP